ncbi:MAG: DUF72 domain-containing protein, partial [Dehalococcoidia bacterium]
YNVGLCVFDMPGFSCPLVATADFSYIRFHGSQGLYASCYSPDELGEWAGRIKALPPETGTVYVYFNNDAEAFAVRNATTLGSLLEG